MKYEVARTIRDHGLKERRNKNAMRNVREIHARGQTSVQGM